MSTATLDKTGRIVIPAEVRAESDLLPGEELIVITEGPGEVRVMTRKAALRRAQERLARLKNPMESVVDEFLADRRREVDAENAR